MPKTHSQTGLEVLCCINTTDIILTQFKYVKNKAKVGGGVARSWGVGKKSHTHTYIHIHLEKFFQILAFFFKVERGSAFCVCDVCGMRFEPPSLQEMYTASRYTITLYPKQP